MKALAAKFLAVVVLGVMAFNARAVYIYDNSVNDMTNRLSATDTSWFGDEVTMGGAYPGNSVMTHFDFQYWAEGTTGLTIDVELRLNNGTTNYTGYDSPGTLLYSYYGFGLTDTGRATLNFDAGVDFSASGIYLPGDTLTLAVRFNFNGGGGSAGVDLYNPPVVGSSYIDYWQYNGSNWELTTNNVFGTVNFGMRIEAVPEPSSFSLFLLGGLSALGLGRYLRRK